MAEEFTLPAFLENCDVDTLHESMLSLLPDDIDKTEGGFVWDFTRPTALIAAELLQYYIVEAIKLIFPQWSYGTYLDYLASQAQLVRKAAVKATVTLTITGDAGIVIPEGTAFATADINDQPSIEFTTDASATIGAGGTVTVAATAAEGGAASNVEANTITLMVEPLEGIASVTNAAAATGGINEESDDMLRERIMEASKEADQSYTGSIGDYKRWAESVTGMGTAMVIPEWNGAGTVKIVCIDANGEAASQAITTAVYNYIMRPDEPLERLAPPCVVLTVVAPTLVTVTYSFTVELANEYTVAGVQAVFEEALAKYYKTVSNDGEIKYSKVYSLISSIPGIEDYSSLLINGGTSNITIDADKYPKTGTVTITEGSV